MHRLWWGLLISIAGTSIADGMTSLNSFLQNKKNNSISADFTQTVISNKKTKITVGTMEIVRPNKFRWNYVKEEQLIISDGDYIYIYDKPLKQVTKNKLGNLLGKSPALLLAGGSDIKKYYNVAVIPDSDGLEWVTLIPKNNEDNNGFKLVQIGFNKDSQVLSRMKFVDTFDNKSTIDFSNVHIGIKISKDDFIFIAPKNVDVINSN